MEIVKRHFEEEAAQFDRLIVHLIPRYDEMVDALACALPFASNAPIRVLDLGCGTGTVARRILDSFRNAEVTCVDLAANMIEMARVKLASFERVKYIAGDFSVVDFGPRGATFDAVVSSLALHHLVRDEDKRRFYSRVYSHLAPGGVFYNADIVLGSNDFLQDLYLARWRSFMGRSVSQEEIQAKWIPCTLLSSYAVS